MIRGTMTDYRETVVKGTVDVNSNDPPFVEWHIQFTTVPLKHEEVKKMTTAQRN